MKDLTFSTENGGVFLKQDSDKETVFISFEDLPELVERIESYIEEKKDEAEKVKDVNVRTDYSRCVMIEQDSDDDVVLVEREEVPKLIAILQKYVDKG